MERNAKSQIVDKLIIGLVGCRAKIKRHPKASRSTAIRDAQTVQVESESRASHRS